MEISRQTLFGKLNATLFKSLESATSFCKLRGNTHVELVHWLHQLLLSGDNDCVRLVRGSGMDRDALDRDLTEALTALPAGAASVHDFSSHIMDSVERAWTYTTLALGENRIRSGCWLATLVGTPELRRVLLGMSAQWRKLSPDNMDLFLREVLPASPEAREGAHDGSQLDIRADNGAGYGADLGGPDYGGENSGDLAADASPAQGRGGGKALEKFCTDLTRKARKGELDPVVGRELEIRTMIDILLRRRQNNPLLTGDAGVGKTAVVEGLALAIATGTVPPVLRDVRLLSLDVGGLLAGASMKGEFESRLRSLIDEAGRAATPVILFVDEIHTLVGAGGAQGTGDAANLLKPALARGALRTIGATTWSEYKKHIEKDPALTRRFQPLHIGEPDETSAVEILRGLTDIFRRHHGVVILDEALQAAVRLSSRYIPSRQLPDKAISLLDTACARVALSRSAPPPSVAHARRQVQALRVEEELLHKEMTLCADNTREAEQRAARLTKVREDLNRIEADLVVLEARWQEQLTLAQQLADCRSKLEQEDADDAQAALRPQLREELARLEAALAGCATASASAGTDTGAATDTGTGAECAAETSADIATDAPDASDASDAAASDEPLVFAEVNTAVVASIVADWTGIPVGRMVRDDMRAVMELDAVLARRVMGQDHALALLARRIRTARAQLTDPQKPVGVFFLVGPSGVGKTETALALAEALYGGEQNCICINMSEFQESHTVSTLKGAPPGYVGYGEGGVLTEAVRRRPHSVILLDEIEKAHPDVYEIFYQVFDKGWMEDGEGRYIDFRNTVILLTSNAASERMAQLCADEDLAPEPVALADMVHEELLKVFPAAFLGRLTVVPYYPLRTSALDSIVTLHLGRVEQRLAAHHGMRFSYDAELVAHILERCAVAETGARRIISFIDQHILPEISAVWLDHMYAAGQDKRQEPRATGLHVAVEEGRPLCLIVRQENKI